MKLVFDYFVIPMMNEVKKKKLKRKMMSEAYRFEE